MHLAADGRPLVAACLHRPGRPAPHGPAPAPRRRPEWTGPSGNVQPGETPEQAAVREVSEEVGLTVQVTRRLGDRVHPATERHLIYFACRIVAGELAVAAHEEIAGVEWCDLPSVLER
jgi:8-oxo-dGTP diphosphatase